jgi:Lon protease-like protein
MRRGGRGRRRRREGRARTPVDSDGVSDLGELGLFPLGMVLLPSEHVPLHIFEPRYRQLTADCALEDRSFVMLQAGPEGTARVGCTARLDTLLRRFEDGRMNLTVVGIEPVEILETLPPTDARLYLAARVRPLADEPGEPDPELAETVRALYRALSEQVTGEARDPEVPEGVPVSYAVAGAVDLAVEPKQELLELRDEDERLRRLAAIRQGAAAGMDRAKVAAERAQGNGKVSAP